MSNVLLSLLSAWVYPRRHSARARVPLNTEPSVLNFRKKRMLNCIQRMHKQLKVPFVIYADFESITANIYSVAPNPEKSSTEKYQHHQPCGFSYVVFYFHMSYFEQYSKPPVVIVVRMRWISFLNTWRKKNK